jgi:hypothetical protein
MEHYGDTFDTQIHPEELTEYQDVLDADSLRQSQLDDETEN